MLVLASVFDSIRQDLQQYLDFEAANAAADKKARTTMLQKLRECGHGADELRTFFADLRDNPARALLFTKYSVATGRGSGEQRLEHYMSFLATASQRVTQSTAQMLPLYDRFRSEGLDLAEFAAECASSKEEAGRGDCVVVAGEAVDLVMQKELQKERLFNDARVLCGDLKLAEAVADLQMRQKEAAKEKSSRRRFVERAEDMMEQVVVFSQKNVALQFQQPSSERTRNRLACGEQLQALIGAAVFPDTSSGAGSRISEQEAWRRFDKIIAKGKLCVPDDTDTAEDPGENAEDSSAALEQLGKEIDELFGIGCDELGGAGNGAALRSGSQVPNSMWIEYDEQYQQAQRLSEEEATNFGRLAADECRRRRAIMSNLADDAVGVIASNTVRSSSSPSFTPPLPGVDPESRIAGLDCSRTASKANSSSSASSSSSGDAGKAPAAPSSSSSSACNSSGNSMEPESQSHLRARFGLPERTPSARFLPQNSASDALRRKLEAFTGPLEVDPTLLPEEKWPELLRTCE